MTTVKDGGKAFSLMHRPPLPLRKCSRYSFLLEAESTPGPQCDRKDYVNEKNYLNPKRKKLWNKEHFWENKTHIVEHDLKNAASIFTVIFQSLLFEVSMLREEVSLDRSAVEGP